MGNRKVKPAKERLQSIEDLEKIFNRCRRPEQYLLALRSIANSHGFSRFSRETHVDRAHLYIILSRTGDPRLSTFFRIINSLGLSLVVKAKKKRKPPQTK
jgi:DNA-binding phage protein